MKTTVINVRDTEAVARAKAEGRYVFIGRPSQYGNPFRIGMDGNRAQVIALYRRWLLDQPEMVAHVRRVMTGKTLGCFCSPAACHGQVLADLCNAPEDPFEPVSMRSERVKE